MPADVPLGPNDIVKACQCGVTSSPTTPIPITRPHRRDPLQTGGLSEPIATALVGPGRCETSSSAWASALRRHHSARGPHLPAPPRGRPGRAPRPPRPHAVGDRAGRPRGWRRRPRPVHGPLVGTPWSIPTASSTSECPTVSGAGAVAAASAALQAYPRLRPQQAGVAGSTYVPSSWPARPPRRGRHPLAPRRHHLAARWPWCWGSSSPQWGGRRRCRRTRWPRSRTAGPSNDGRRRARPRRDGGQRRRSRPRRRGRSGRRPRPPSAAAPVTAPLPPAAISTPSRSPAVRPEVHGRQRGAAGRPPTPSRSSPSTTSAIPPPKRCSPRWASRSRPARSRRPRSRPPSPMNRRLETVGRRKSSRSWWVPPTRRTSTRAWPTPAP